MYNWSGTNPHKFSSLENKEVWQLEQAINFGLNETKLSKTKLKKYWKRLVIDQTKKKLLQALLFKTSA